MNPVIQISNLSKTYASGFQALKQVNLEIRDGEIFALLGPNGAGKTTLMECLAGMRPRSGGTFYIGDEAPPSWIIRAL